MELQELIALVDRQEELLRLKTFNSSIAWKLGNLFHEKIVKEDLPIAVSIRSINGKTLFHYSSDKANYGSQGWLDRKFNTVRHFETSTLRYALFPKPRRHPARTGIGSVKVRFRWRRISDSYH